MFQGGRVLCGYDLLRTDGPKIDEPSLRDDLLSRFNSEDFNSLGLAISLKVKDAYNRPVNRIVLKNFTERKQFTEKENIDKEQYHLDKGELITHVGRGTGATLYMQHPPVAEDSEKRGGRFLFRSRRDDLLSRFYLEESSALIRLGNLPESQRCVQQTFHGKGEYRQPPQDRANYSCYGEIWNWLGFLCSVRMSDIMLLNVMAYRLPTLNMYTELSVYTDSATLTGFECGTVRRTSVWKRLEAVHLKLSDLLQGSEATTNAANSTLCKPRIDRALRSLGFEDDDQLI
ncbi:hypothetical protein L1887_61782 [Cichorium endivia]|nr:hypothetical protein L1887_61782 [Cichorium endivia]